MSAPTVIRSTSAENPLSSAGIINIPIMPAGYPYLMYKFISSSGLYISSRLLYEPTTFKVNVGDNNHKSSVPFICLLAMPVSNITKPTPSPL